MQALIKTKEITPDTDLESLIKEFVPLIKYLANRFAFRLPPYLDVDDLVNAGIVGLMHAVDNYSKDKNTQFRTYAEYRVRGAMLDEIRAMDWLPRSIRDKVNLLEKTYQKLEKKFGRPARDYEVAEDLDVSIDKLHTLIFQAKGVTLINMEDLKGEDEDDSVDILSRIADKNSKDPLSLVILSDIQECLGSAIDVLPEKERIVVSLYYYDGLTMKEIGKVLGITESRVSQLHTQAILRLRGKIAEHIQSDIVEKK